MAVSKEDKAMHFKTSIYLKIAILFIFSGTLTFAQSSNNEKPKERPKIKDFGSSLKRLKWNTSKNAVEEVKRNQQQMVDSDDDVLRVETTLVVCDVLVTDKKGRPVEGLALEDFVVTEDEQPQKVESFALGNNTQIARTIVLLIDYSGSQFPFIQTSVAAAKTLIDKLNPNDRMAIVTDDIELLADFTSDKEKLKKKLDSLEKKVLTESGFFNRSRRFGRSAQYSALMATLNEAFDANDKRPIIIFQTDGDELGFLRNSNFLPPLPANSTNIPEEILTSYHQTQRFYQNNAREFSLQDIYNAAEKSRTTIYTVIPGFQFEGLSDDKQVEQMKAYTKRSVSMFNYNAEMTKRFEERLNKTSSQVFKFQAGQIIKMQTALKGVAEMTGGWTDFLETPEQAADIYSRILSDINSRYVIGYYPTNAEADGKRRKVNVEVRNHPEYVIWGRKTYVATTR